MAHGGNGRDVLPDAVVVWGGDEHGADGWVLPKCPVDVVWVEHARHAEGFQNRGKDKGSGQVQKGGGMCRRFVAVAVEQHIRPGPGGRIEHGVHALG